MGKQRRQERRHADRARRSAGRSAEVADRAEASLAGLIEEITAMAAAQGVAVRHVHLDRFEKLRSSFLDKGYRWAPWCYLPLAVAGAGLGERLAIDPNAAHVSPATLVASVVAAWMPGRIAVRFDDDLADALMATPLESTIPTDALHRLPAWGLYVDCRGLGRARGFFVALDSGRIEAPGRPPANDVDELLVAVVKDDAEGARHLLSTVWLQAGTSIADSMTAQARQSAASGPGLFEAGEDEWAAEMGMPRAEALARILSLVLYLCSAGADMTQRAIPVGAGGRRRVGPVTVVSAGFRVGAALRGASDAARAHGDNPTGRRVAPHLRRAHWHSYWCGSDARGDRHLELRWVPPVPVNAELADELLTVVRSAGHVDA